MPILLEEKKLIYIADLLRPDPPSLHTSPDLLQSNRSLKFIKLIAGKYA